jgi:hypothetical protein
MTTTKSETFHQWLDQCFRDETYGYNTDKELIEEEFEILWEAGYFEETAGECGAK